MSMRQFDVETLPYGVVDDIYAHFFFDDNNAAVLDKENIVAKSGNWNWKPIHVVPV